MKKFTFKGVLENFKSSLNQTHKTVNEVEEFLRKENFSFANVIKHGFPHSASSLAHDPVQNIIAIGTSNGYIRIFGKPGVESDLQHETSAAVQQLIFIINEGYLVSVCSDDVIHLWNIKTIPAVVTHSLKFQRERITCVHLPFQSKWLYVGTYKGNIHVVNIETFKLSGYIINWNKTIELISKFHPGAIVHVSDCPVDSNKLLIGFETGTCVLWDLKNKAVEGRYVHNIPLTSTSWHFEGKTFMSSHADGSLVTWNVKLLCGLISKPLSIVFPHARNQDQSDKCNPIDKIEWRETKSGDNLYIFSGGLIENIPTITVIYGKSTTVLEMEHRIVDFMSLSKSPYVIENIEPSAIIVLFSNDLIIIDLTTLGYPCFENPFALDMHECEITVLKYYSDCPTQTIPILYSCGMKQKKLNYSEKSWPLNGGDAGLFTTSYSELLVTGHSDGSLKFWDASALNLQILYRLKTNKIFERVLEPENAMKVTSPKHDRAADNSHRLEESISNRMSPIPVLQQPQKQQHPTNKTIAQKSCLKLLYEEEEEKENLDSHIQSAQNDSYVNNETTNTLNAQSRERFFRHKKICLPVCALECNLQARVIAVALKKKRYSFLVVYTFDKQEVNTEIPVLQVPNPSLYPSIEASSDNEDKNTPIHRPKYIIKVKSGNVKQSAGYQAELVLEFHYSIAKDGSLRAMAAEETVPSIKIIKFDTNTSTLAIGTSYGLCVVDYLNKHIILNLSTPDFYGTNDPFSRTSISSSKPFHFLKNKNNNDATSNSYADKCKSPSLEIANTCDSASTNNTGSGTVISSSTSPLLPPSTITSKSNPSDKSVINGGKDRRIKPTNDGSGISYGNSPQHGGTTREPGKSSHGKSSKTTGTSAGGITALAKAKIQKAHSFISFNTPLSSMGSTGSPPIRHPQPPPIPPPPKHSQIQQSTNQINNLEYYHLTHTNNNISDQPNSSSLFYVSGSTKPVLDSEHSCTTTTRGDTSVVTNVSSANTYGPSSNVQYTVNNLQSPLNSPTRAGGSNNPSLSEFESVTALAFYRSIDDLDGDPNVDDFETDHASSSNFPNMANTESNGESTITFNNVNEVNQSCPNTTLYLWMGTSYGSIIVLKFSQYQSPNNKLTSIITPSGTIFRLKGRILLVEFMGANLYTIKNNDETADSGMKNTSADTMMPSVGPNTLASASLAKKAQEKTAALFTTCNKKAPAPPPPPTGPVTPLSNTPSLDSLSHSSSYQFQGIAPCPRPVSIDPPNVSSGSNTSGGESQSQQPQGVGSKYHSSTLDGSRLPPTNGNPPLLSYNTASSDVDLNAPIFDSTTGNLSQKIPASPIRTTACNKEFAILVSENQACSISLRQTSYMSVLYKVKISNETRIALVADVVTFNSNECLTCYTSNGNILIYSLPSFRILMDVYVISPLNLRFSPLHHSDRPSNCFCFGDNGNGLYLCSPSEIQKFTFSAETCKNLDDMTCRVYKAKDTPEPPKSNFFSNLFNVQRNNVLDREELFGEATSGKGSRTAAVLLQDVNRKVIGTASGPVQRARQAAAERGEKLGELDDKTAQMLIHSETYAKTAHDVLQKYKDKKWYQF